MGARRLPPIPDRLNLVITMTVATIMLSCLYLFQNTESLIGKIGILIVFSLAFITNYSMLHEVGHQKEHSKKWGRFVIGNLTATMFFTSRSFFEVQHWNHHLRNRSALETFDLLGPGDKKVSKTIMWYLYLSGTGYAMIPVGSLFIVLFGGLFIKFMNMLKGYYFSIKTEDIEKYVTTQGKLEIIGCYLFHFTFAYLAGIELSTYLIVYLLGSMWWATLAYVEHAYAPIDLVKGAYNLKASKWFSYIELHRELDYFHHHYPRLSWYYLPKVKMPGHEIPSDRLYKQYIRMWTQGLMLSQEKRPEPLEEFKGDYSNLMIGGQPC